MSGEVPIIFRIYEDPNGVLCAYESEKQVPFCIQRIFTVTANAGDFRGNHAHRRCSQLLVCLAGKILVNCNNGHEDKEYLLDNMGTGLLVPPGIWAQQNYLVNNSLLMVLCDRLYEADDYIHSHSQFKSFLMQGIRETL